MQVYMAAAWNNTPSTVDDTWQNRTGASGEFTSSWRLWKLNSFFLGRIIKRIINDSSCMAPHLHFPYKHVVDRSFIKSFQGIHPHETQNNWLYNWTCILIWVPHKLRSHSSSGRSSTKVKHKYSSLKLWPYDNYYSPSCTRTFRSQNNF